MVNSLNVGRFEKCVITKLFNIVFILMSVSSFVLSVSRILAGSMNEYVEPVSIKNFKILFGSVGDSNSIKGRADPWVRLLK